MLWLRNLILPPLIAGIYWLWSHTWRLIVVEHAGFLKALESGPVVFAHWHGDEMAIFDLGRRYRCAVMTSTSRDGELLTRVLKLFGYGISRGSSTRGGARALLGMITLTQQGYNASVALDGPRGPRHKVKPGILFLSRKHGLPIVPVGVACKRAIVFQKSWNKAYLPLPFTEVAVSLGPPFRAGAETTAEDVAGVMRMEQESAGALLERPGAAGPGTRAPRR